MANLYRYNTSPSFQNPRLSNASLRGHLVLSALLGFICHYGMLACAFGVKHYF